MRQICAKNFVIILIILLLFPLNVISAEKFRLWDISFPKEILTFKNIYFPDSKNTPQHVLNYMFRYQKKFFVKVILVKNGVAYVNIERNSMYITNQSGSTGAFHFEAKVVFNLTEFNNIDYVYFVDEGDHFSMGKYERLDYWNLMTDYRKRLHKKELENRLNAKDESVYSYVRKLAEVGDKYTISELEALKKQCRMVSSCCDNNTINEAITKINSRLHRSKWLHKNNMKIFLNDKVLLK